MLGLLWLAWHILFLSFAKKQSPKAEAHGEFRNRLDSIRALFASQHHFAILCCWTPSCSNPLQYLIIYNRSLDITLCHLFVHTFIAMGYYTTPKEVIPKENDAEAKVTEAEDMKDGKNTHGTNILTANRKMEIELALKKWCEEGFYKDYEVNIYSLATKLGYKKNELTEYFNQSEYTNFRTWLSDIRFNEAVRMMKANPNIALTLFPQSAVSHPTHGFIVYSNKNGHVT